MRVTARITSDGRGVLRLARDDRGGILVVMAMALVAFIGALAITIDLGRLAATQGDLQAYVDHVALAAAGELDGGDDAILRARAAAEQLIDDRQTFGEGDRALGDAADYSLRFLDALPGSDRADVTPFVTSDPNDATLVEVTATPRQVFMPFARSLAAMLGVVPPRETTGAVAIAGYTQYACDVAPLMFCLPSPDYKADDNVGVSVRLRTGGRNAAWGPGDFGFLDPTAYGTDPNGPCDGMSGSKLISCLIATAGNGTRCVAQRGVDIEPGQKVGIENAVFNTRFDMFTGGMSKERGNPDYAPGPHVVSGLAPASNGNGNGNSCVPNNADATGDTMPFPPDDCFSAGTCQRFGNGTWTSGRDAYVDMNYGTDVADPQPSARSRWEYYLDEIETADGAFSPSGPAPILPGRSETGRPRCSQAPMIDDPERRIFIVAGIDCDRHGIQGAASGVPVKEFFKVFLLQPVGEGTDVTFIEEGVSKSAKNFDLWVEIVGSAGGAGNSTSGGIFRDFVELYR